MAEIIERERRLSDLFYDCPDVYERVETFALLSALGVTERVPP